MARLGDTGPTFCRSRIKHIDDYSRKQFRETCIYDEFYYYAICTIKTHANIPWGECGPIESMQNMSIYYSRYIHTLTKFHETKLYSFCLETKMIVSQHLTRCRQKTVWTRTSTCPLELWHSLSYEMNVTHTPQITV